MTDYERMMLMLAARQVRLLEALCHSHDLEDVAGEREFRAALDQYINSRVVQLVEEELNR